MAAGLLSHGSSFYSGVGGRVVIDNQIAVFVKEWSLEVSTEIYGAPTFESPVYPPQQPPGGLAWDVKRFIGLSEAKVELSGYALAGVELELSLGAMVSLVLFINVDSGLGIVINRAIVQNISYSQDATGTSPVELKLSLEVDGPVGLPEG
jgi:hypothetical protein